MSQDSSIGRSMPSALVLSCFLLALLALLASGQVQSKQTSLLSSSSPPRIIQYTPRSVTVVATESNSDVIFECYVQSQSHARIWWRKNNKKLSESNRKFRVTHAAYNASFLRVAINQQYHQTKLYSDDPKNRRKNNSGGQGANRKRPRTNYSLNITCVAENAYGQVESTAQFNVIDESDRKAEKFPIVSISKPRSVEPDQMFHIECNVSRLTHPGSQVDWYQGNKPISLLNNESAGQNTKYLVNFTKVNNDTYRHFLYVLKGLSLSTGVGSDGSKTTVASESVEVDFLCMATNMHGASSAETSIMLRNRLMPPIFVSPKRSIVEVEHGSSVNVTCQANGMPRPRVKWLEGDFNVNDLSELSYAQMSSQSANTITKAVNIDILHIVNLTQQRNFTCYAQNSFGLVVFNLSLVIKDKPDPPIGPNVSTIYSNSIELEWRPPPGHSVADILYYIVKYRRYHEQHWLDELNNDLDRSATELNELDPPYIHINTTNTKLKIGNNMLKPFTSYEFKLQAANLHGFSRETEPLVVRTAATKPGYVRNIRYVHVSDATFSIKCEPPEDSNGNLMAFKIYHTDQVTNPIRIWQSIQVPVSEMPYRLTVDLNSLARKKTKRGFAYNSVDQLVYFVRVSAVNAELGEGPYSNIVELKKMDIKFEAPLHLELQAVNSSSAQLKWEYRLDIIKHLNKNFLYHMHYAHQNNPYYSMSSLTQRTYQDLDLIKNLQFVFYLKNRQFLSEPTQDRISVHLNNRNFLRDQQLQTFRNLSATSCLNLTYFEKHHHHHHRQRDTSAETNQFRVLAFQYNLTNLYANTEYSIEVAAKWFSMESESSHVLKFITQPQDASELDKQNEIRINR